MKPPLIAIAYSDEHLGAGHGPDTLSAAARFAYEMCETGDPQTNPAEVAAVACDGNTDRIWEELTTLRGPACYRVALQPLLPEVHQWAYARSGDGSAITALLDNPDCPTGIVDHVVVGGRLDGLEHPNVSYSLLVEHHDGDGDVYVARNPNSGVLLDTMATRAVHAAGQDGWSVARALATNPNYTPAGSLVALLDKEWGDNWYTRSLVTMHPNTPVEAIQAILEVAPQGTTSWAIEARRQLAHRLAENHGR